MTATSFDWRQIPLREDRTQARRIQQAAAL